MQLNEFYFIYVLTGCNYIKTAVHNFKWLPKEANVVVITNTPKCLENYNPHFNLIIVDLESLRDDWSREHEFVLDIEDDQEYMLNLARMYSEGYRYPMAIMRYGMKWAYQNNVLNFSIIDVGVKIGFIRNAQDALNEILEISKEFKNVLLASNFVTDIEKGNSPESLWPRFFPDLLEKYNLNDLDWEKPIQTEIERDTHKTPIFDGWGYGFILSNTELVKSYFDIWNDIVKLCYEKNIIFAYTHWTKEFEWHHMMISSAFSRKYDLFIMGHKNLYRHYYHPENDYFAASKKMIGSGYIDSDNRKEFIKLNKQRLSANFGMAEDQLEKIIYDFE